MRKLARIFLILFVSILPASLALAVDPPNWPNQFVEIPPDGQGPHGYIFVPETAPLLSSSKATAQLVTLFTNGTTSKRANLVFIGDGYTTSDLNLYATHVNNLLTSIFEHEPFKEYKSLYNAYRLDVVSEESGVDNDPVLGIAKNTALGMYFWCGNIERLLCVDNYRVQEYAKLAPANSQFIALANSTKYGGSGGTNAAASGGNIYSSDVLLHELGHSFGKLADEYERFFTPYNGPEPTQSNISIHNSSSMAQSGLKWANWLGTDPSVLFGQEFGEQIGTHEGASLGTSGIFRPTSLSRMRLTTYPFNIVAIESFIIQLYKNFASPIEKATKTKGIKKSTQKLTVLPAKPATHDLEIQWYVNSKKKSGATGTSFRMSKYKYPKGTHHVKVVVRDNTAWVRNEQARKKYMTESRSYYVRVH